MKKIRFVLLFFITSISIAISASVVFSPDWRTADRSSVGIAPDPAIESEAIVQVYAARAFNWRSIFAVHTWLATKAEDASEYNVYQVVGWRKSRGLPVVVKEQDIPDRSWFGNSPTILREVKGAEAVAMISSIEYAVSSYPYHDTYHMWPGPNSNTFIAHIGRSVPELHLDLPPTAIGKDFMTRNRFLDTPPSGNGTQFSFFGLFGGLISAVEGIEINIFSLSFGLGVTPHKIWPLKIRLPLIGIIRLGVNTDTN
jgi:hypothetical protein